MSTENTPKPQLMSNRREVRDELLKQAGWVKLPNGKWMPPQPKLSGVKEPVR